MLGCYNYSNGLFEIQVKLQKNWYLIHLFFQCVCDCDKFKWVASGDWSFMLDVSDDITTTLEIDYAQNPQHIYHTATGITKGLTTPIVGSTAKVSCPSTMLLQVHVFLNIIQRGISFTTNHFFSNAWATWLYMCTALSYICSFICIQLPSFTT